MKSMTIAAVHFLPFGPIRRTRSTLIWSMVAVTEARSALAVGESVARGSGQEKSLAVEGLGQEERSAVEGSEQKERLAAEELRQEEDAVVARRGVGEAEGKKKGIGIW